MAAARRHPVRPPTAIRWDRMGRCALLFVLVFVVYLYVGPTRSWISTYRESKQRHADVRALQAENAHLKARRDQLRKASTMEAEARSLGMVRAGEKAYVVRGLPPG